MKENFNWEIISNPPKKTDILINDHKNFENVDNKESEVEISGIIKGEIEEIENEIVVIRTKFGNLQIPINKFKKQFPDEITNGKIELTLFNPDKLARLILNTLLKTD